jgi:hypothetical protein
MKRRTLGILVALVALSVASTAYAGPVLPTYSTYGTLAGATFGGTGIPNDDVAISTVAGTGGDVITLGLTAFKRYANPEVGDDNMGTFFATPGVNDGLDFPSHSLGTTWGFGYYIDVKTAGGGAGSIGNYWFDLLYDFNPGVGTDDSTLGRLHLTNWAAAYGAASTFQDSQNLYFGFLGTDITGYVAKPTYLPFNANAGGEYSFSLRAYTSSTAATPLGESAIQVNVVPDGGTSATLLGSALLGLGFLRRKFRG